MQRESKRNAIKALGEYTVKKGKKQRDEIVVSDDEIDAGLVLDFLDYFTTPQEYILLLNERIKVRIFFYFLNYFYSLISINSLRISLP